jgi:hypothetical protein
MCVYIDGSRECRASVRCRERSARVSRLCMEKVWRCILLVAYSLRNKERQFHFEIVKIPQRFPCGSPARLIPRRARWVFSALCAPRALCSIHIIYMQREREQRREGMRFAYYCTQNSAERKRERWSRQNPSRCAESNLSKAFSCSTNCSPVLMLELLQF